MRLSIFVLAAVLCVPLSASAAVVQWVDWTSGTTGNSGSATGTINAGGGVNVNYTGQIQFIQTTPATDYWNPSGPYVSSLVDNAPDQSMGSYVGTTDIIALSTATTHTLTFSQAIDNLFFAVVSLNGNGYKFDSDFEIVSFGAGYWGNGTLTKQDLGGGQFELDGSGEPHGVIRFTGAVSSITWTSLTDENWNGFTVGTYGLADTTVPEPTTLAIWGLGALSCAVAAYRRKQAA